MNIALRGPFLGNLGDVLMVQAIMERLGARHVIGMAPNWAPYAQRACHGLLQVTDVAHSRLLDDVLARFLLKRFRRSFGLIAPRNVDVVFDCSGYAYGDPWGIGRLQRAVDELSRWKQRGAAIILLPQAFGPFSDPAMHRPVRQMLQMGDLVFAREQTSYDFLASTGAAMDHVYVAPDFTAAVGPLIDPMLSIAPGTVGIVPNQRMLDRTARDVREAYLPFLQHCIRHFVEKGIPIVLLVHEIKDMPLAERIVSESNLDLRITRHDDPRVLKGIIAQCRALVASRTHSMISALSQGVPVLGTSWAHKYPELFAQYGCSQMLLDVRASKETLEDALSNLLDDAARADRVAQLHERAALVRRQIGVMWEKVEAHLAGREACISRTN
jgi:hypothetical protein